VHSASASSPSCTPGLAHSSVIQGVRAQWAVSHHGIPGRPTFLDHRGWTWSLDGALEAGLSYHLAWCLSSVMFEWTQALQLKVILSAFSLLGG
jgi:ABC-type sulfate transport system permease subunit